MTIRVLFFLALLLLFPSISLAEEPIELGTQMPTLELAYDFYYLWAGGHAALNNQNPYVQTVLAEHMWQAGRPKEWSLSWYPYPPWSFFYFIPFALLPYALAKILWVLCSVCALVFCINWCGRSDFARKELGFSYSLPIVFSVALVFPPILRSFLLGQSTFILLLGILGYFSFARARRDVTAGIALSLTFLKFNNFMPIYGVLLGNAIREKRWKSIVSASLALFFQLGFALIFFPDAISSYFQFWFDHGADISAVPVSLARFLGDAFQVKSLQFVLPLAIFFLSLGWATKREVSLKHLAIYILPLSILVTPYAWVHTSLLLLLPYLYIVDVIRKRKRFGYLIIPLLALQFGYFLKLFSEQRPEVYGVWIPITIMLSVLALSQLRDK